MKKQECPLCGEYKILLKDQKMCWDCYIKNCAFGSEWQRRQMSNIKDLEFDDKNFNNEVWRKVVGSTRHEVSNYGSVKKKTSKVSSGKEKNG